MSRIRVRYTVKQNDRNAMNYGYISDHVQLCDNFAQAVEFVRKINERKRNDPMSIVGKPIVETA